MHVLNINYLLILNCLYLANALICFECFSSSFGYCGIHFHPLKASRAICYRNESLCFIEKSTINGIQVITRNCGTANRCANKTNCVTCTTPLCNSSANSLRSKLWQMDAYIVAVLIGMYYILR